MIDNVILCVKKGKCYDSVDNIEYIAYVSNDGEGCIFLSCVWYELGDGLVLFSRKQALTLTIATPML